MLYPWDGTAYSNVWCLSKSKMDPYTQEFSWQLKIDAKKLEKRDGFPLRSALKFKILKREKCAFRGTLTRCFTVFLLIQMLRSFCDYGVCTDSQTVLFGSERERHVLILKVHVIQFSSFESGEEREISGWWNPKEKWHKVICSWNQAAYCLVLADRLLCRFYLACLYFLFKITL